MDNTETAAVQQQPDSPYVFVCSWKVTISGSLIVVLGVFLEEETKTFFYLLPADVMFQSEATDAHAIILSDKLRPYFDEELALCLKAVFGNPRKDEQGGQSNDQRTKSSKALHARGHSEESRRGA